MGESIERSAQAVRGAVQRLALAPVEAPDPRARHTFDDASRTLSELIYDYVCNSVAVELVPQGREGVNVDVGEAVEFDIRIGNHGSLPLADVRVEVVARRGGLSDRISRDGTYWDAETRRCVIEWAAPRDPRLELRLSRLDAGQTAQGTVPEFLGGGESCRRMFAYRPRQPTAGVDNDRDVETLVTARIVSGRLGDIDPIEVDGPASEFESFIQRS
jgi:hypothetical protein